MHIHILFWDEVGTILCHPPSILSELGPFWEEERDFGTTLGRDFFWDQFGIILGRFRNHTFFPNWSQVFHCSEWFPVESAPLHPAPSQAKAPSTSTQPIAPLSQVQTATNTISFPCPIALK